jgi:hypothetical protein
VRGLLVLRDVFRDPMASVPGVAAQAMLPQLDTIVQLHTRLAEQMAAHQASGASVCSLFTDAAAVGALMEASTPLCAVQSQTIAQLTALGTSNPEFAAFLQAAEARPECQRLTLKDHISSVMQRITRYALLVEAIVRDTPPGHAEYEVCQQALENLRVATRRVRKRKEETDGLGRSGG